MNTKNKLILAWIATIIASITCVYSFISIVNDILKQI